MCRAGLALLVFTILSSVSTAAALDDLQPVCPAGDCAAAIREWLPLAEKGDAAAQTRLGALYQKGEGVPRNPVEAFTWYLKAAEQGYAPAQNRVAEFYDRGVGVAANPAEALQWYLRSAGQGYAPAQQNLAGLYFVGRHVPRDEVQAASWYRKAAEQGLASAQVTLGMLYSQGDGVVQSHEIGASWSRRAAEQGDLNALIDLGVRYGRGSGVNRNPVLGYLFLELAAARGSTYAAQLRDREGAPLTPEQLNEAKQLAAAWTVGQAFPRSTLTWRDPAAASRDCGWADLRGKVTMLPQLAEVSAFVEGIAAAKNTQGFWGYIDTGGQWIVPATYQKAVEPTEGFGIVMYDGMQGAINLKRPDTPPVHWFESAKPVSQGMMRVRVQHKWGYYDVHASRLVIEARFDQAQDFQPDGFAVVWFGSQKRFIDRSGQFLAGGPWVDVTGFSEGLAAVNKGEQWGFIDVTGQLVIPYQFRDPPAPFHEGLAAASSGERTGFINRQGVWAIPPRYAFASRFGDGRAFVEDIGGEGVYLVDTVGRRVGKASFLNAGSFAGGRAFVVNRNGKPGLIDRNGRWVFALDNPKTGPYPVSDQNGSFLPDGKISFCRKPAP